MEPHDSHPVKPLRNAMQQWSLVACALASVAVAWACGGQTIQGAGPMQSGVGPTPVGSRPAGGEDIAKASPSPAIPKIAGFADVKGHFEKYCQACHAEGKQKADTPYDTEERISAARVQIQKRIRNYNGLGEMPPKSKQDDAWPTAKSQMLVWLEKGSESASTSGGSSSSTSSSTAGSSYTYEANAKAILTKYCTTCHKAGGQAADWPLTTFAEVNNWRADIISAVAGGSMPKLNPTFKTSPEADVLLKWLRAEGDLKER